MQALRRLTWNHLEFGIHPRIGSFFINPCIFGFGIRFQFELKALKKALLNTRLGFGYCKVNGYRCVRLLGFEVVTVMYDE